MLHTLKRIPGYSNYGITENGRLFNLLENKELKTSPDPRGYHRTVLVNDNGERKGVKRHRLLALTHLEWPDRDIEDYVANHLDLIPGNDWKHNLEWATQKRNVEHWSESGLNRKIKIPVETLDGEDGKLTRYNSIGECSKDLGIERYSIQLRLDRGPQYVWPEGKRYRVGHNSEPWPAVEKLEYGRSREVLMKDLRTGRKVLVGKLSDTLPFIGYKLAAVWNWASDPKQPVVPGLFQLQFCNELKPWREVSDVFEELQEGMKGKVVFTFDEGWKNPIWYESASTCAALNDLKTTALNYRLKSKGQKVFGDGRRYCYYDDLTEDQKKTIRYEIPPEGRVQRPSKATLVPNESMTAV